jgi:hypothetical protein
VSAELVRRSLILFSAVSMPQAMANMRGIVAGMRAGHAAGVDQ